MASRTLHVISAGAAQSVVERLGAQFESEHDIRIASTFGAVGAQKERLLSGADADIVLLTAALIDELIASGHVRPGSRADLGPVGSGVAVPTGSPAPDVATPQALAAALQAARAVYIPDPVKSTAGIQFMKNCERLGVADAVRPRLQPYPNGFAAMTAMAAEARGGEIGVTQMTEILYVGGVTLIGPMPAELQSMTTYSLGMATRSAEPGLAAEFAARVAGAAGEAARREAGFGMR